MVTRIGKIEGIEKELLGVAKIQRNKAIRHIESSISILEDLRRYLLEDESVTDKDEDYQQQLLDGISEVANQRADNPDKTPIVRIKLRQPDVTITVTFDVSVEFHD
jgi:hypothetical protein